MRGYGQEFGAEWGEEFAEASGLAREVGALHAKVKARVGAAKEAEVDASEGQL